MIRFLEIPDFHFDIRWKEESEKIIKKIIETVKDEGIDFIAMSGDIYNRPIYATDKGGLNILRGLIKQLTDIIPVCTIYGTPSHDAPGSLEPLEDIGLVVLEPNKIYGLFSYVEGVMKDIIQINPKYPHTKPDCIIFGVPEINKKKIMEKYQIPASESNAMAVNLFDKYIKSFVAPMRLKYQDIPAVGLFHGVVSDSKQENETDIIKRSSDIVIHSKILEKANLDRWALGHIHKPWESEKICAGYAGFTGMDDKPWGALGFKPSMNMVDIDALININRIPYGTQERRKILQPLSEYDPNIAYWLYSSNPEAKLPDNVHPWSRTTFNIEKQESRRVTREQAENIKTLTDLFQTFNPKAKKSILEKVDNLELKSKKELQKLVNFKLEYVKITGCDFFQGQEIEFDISKANEGLTRIHGNNGEGKSSLLSFCSPYPVVIGKDTLSGRQSAIKDFFSGQDCQIIKRGKFSHVDHEHIINIKGAHTQNPKVECFFNVNGESILEKGSFDEMFKACEEFYGPFEDYLLTTFYIQPLQGKANSNLIEAPMTEIRNLVQSIAGINRSKEKEYALDKVSNLKKEIEVDESWLKNVEEFKADIPNLKSKLNSITDQFFDLEPEQERLVSMKEATKSQLENATQKRIKSESEEARKDTDLESIRNLESDLIIKNKQIETIIRDTADLAKNKKLVEQDNKNREEKNKQDEILNHNKSLKQDYETALKSEKLRVKEINDRITANFNKKSNGLENSLERFKNKLKVATHEIELLSKACPKCGYLEENSLKKIKELELQISEIESRQAQTKKELEGLSFPEYEKENNIDRPEYKPEDFEPVFIIQDYEREKLKDKIKTAEESESKKITLEEAINNINKSLENLRSQKYDIDPDSYATEIKIKKELSEIEKFLNDLSEKKIRLETEEKNIKEKIEKAKELEKKIVLKTKELKTKNKDFEDWNYIATMLQPAKIPALELELVLDIIDYEASRIIEPFLEGRYSYDTRTQLEGKTGKVDKFDIKIHDNQVGKSKSFVQHSPGEKAFFADAYTKALILQRNQRAKRFYDPVIMDESDGPIQPERLSAYYDIQKKYWGSSKVLIVSHNPVSHQFIENTIELKELKK